MQETGETDMLRRLPPTQKRVDSIIRPGLLLQHRKTLKFSSVFCSSVLPHEAILAIIFVIV